VRVLCFRQRPFDFAQGRQVVFEIVKVLCVFCVCGPRIRNGMGIGGSMCLFSAEIENGDDFVASHLEGIWGREIKSKTKISSRVDLLAPNAQPANGP
jgi:hypothetical protein